MIDAKQKIAKMKLWMKHHVFGFVQRKKRVYQCQGSLYNERPRFKQQFAQ